MSRGAPGSVTPFKDCSLQADIMPERALRHIQAGKYADTYVQVTGSLLNRVEVGEERQVSKLNFFKPYSCTDEAFRVTNITVVSTVILPDVLKL